jgi:hypothetical protein
MKQGQHFQTAMDLDEVMNASRNVYQALTHPSVYLS